MDNNWPSLHKHYHVIMKNILDKNFNASGININSVKKEIQKGKQWTHMIRNKIFNNTFQLWPYALKWNLYDNKNCANNAFYDIFQIMGKINRAIKQAQIFIQRKH